MSGVERGPYRSIWGPFAEHLARLRVGSTFHEAGYSSFTYDPAVALSFAHEVGEVQVLIVLEDTVGCPFLYIDGVREALIKKPYIRWSTSTGPGWVFQAEVLLSKDVVFEVIGRRRVGSVTSLTVRCRAMIQCVQP